MNLLSNVSCLMSNVFRCFSFPRARSEMDITEASEASVLGSNPSEHRSVSLPPTKEHRMPFLFETLLVYKKSLQMVRIVNDLHFSLKTKVAHSTLDQLLRASLSVPLNIAEGNGRWHANERKRFLLIARGSTYEIVPIIQILKEMGQIDPKNYEILYGLLEEISKMLSGMIRVAEEMKAESRH
jgi:four helix bundle protein